ncbi:hypothetical protein FRC12_000846 [Ceratobasidium sp. 428]|nr:hypothetical protein FRC12_000846 [Ceratobasidium sp. 428]
MTERWGGYWKGVNTWWDPKRGHLRWVGKVEDRPVGSERIQRTKSFVLRSCVAGDVKTVVEESAKWKYWETGMEWANEEGNWWVRAETLNQWVSEVMWDWKKKTPASYVGEVETLEKGEVYDLVVDKKLCKKQFSDYLDQYAWDCAQEGLDRDMRELARKEGWEEGEVPEGGGGVKIVVAHAPTSGELVQLAEILDLTDEILDEKELGEHAVWV